MTCRECNGLSARGVQQTTAAFAPQLLQRGSCRCCSTFEDCNHLALGAAAHARPLQLQGRLMCCSGLCWRPVLPVTVMCGPHEQHHEQGSSKYLNFSKSKGVCDARQVGHVHQRQYHQKLLVYVFSENCLPGWNTACRQATHITPAPFVGKIVYVQLWQAWHTSLCTFLMSCTYNDMHPSRLVCACVYLALDAACWSGIFGQQRRHPLQGSWESFNGQHSRNLRWSLMPGQAGRLQQVGTPGAHMQPHTVHMAMLATGGCGKEVISDEPLHAMTSHAHIRCFRIIRSCVLRATALRAPVYVLPPIPHQQKAGNSDAIHYNAIHCQVWC